MRRTLLSLTLAAAALGCAALAQDMDGAGTDHYYAELSNQCPDKNLQYLSPRELRDGLDDWSGGLSPDAQSKLKQAETAQCSTASAGVGCVNRADIAAADQQGRTRDLAGAICADFLRCRSPGDCDYAR